MFVEMEKLMKQNFLKFIFMNPTLHEELDFVDKMDQSLNKQDIKDRTSIQPREIN